MSSSSRDLVNKPLTKYAVFSFVFEDIHVAYSVERDELVLREFTAPHLQYVSLKPKKLRTLIAKLTELAKAANL